MSFKHTLLLVLTLSTGTLFAEQSFETNSEIAVEDISEFSSLEEIMAAYPQFKKVLQNYTSNTEEEKLNPTQEETAETFSLLHVLSGGNIFQTFKTIFVGKMVFDTFRVNSDLRLMLGRVHNGNGHLADYCFVGLLAYKAVSLTINNTVNLITAVPSKIYNFVK